MAKRVKLKGRVNKDYFGHLFFETDPPKWGFRKISEKLIGAGYVAGQEVKVTIKPVKKDKELDFSEGPSTPYDLSPFESGP